MSSYTFEHPEGLSQDKVEFIQQFYRTSDTRDVEGYLNFLTEDVEFIMGLNSVTGQQAVRKIRETMWGGVETRKHEPEKVYLADSEQANELMLYGTVSYGLKNGDKVDKVGWAGRMVFKKGLERGQIKMERYQVWLDGAPLSNALKKQAEQSQ